MRAIAAFFLLSTTLLAQSPQNKAEVTEVKEEPKPLGQTGVPEFDDLANHIKIGGIIGRSDYSSVEVTINAEKKRISLTCKSEDTFKKFIAFYYRRIWEREQKHYRNYSVPSFEKNWKDNEQLYSDYVVSCNIIKKYNVIEYELYYNDIYSDRVNSAAHHHLKDVLEEWPGQVEVKGAKILVVEPHIYKFKNDY